MTRLKPQIKRKPCYSKAHDSVLLPLIRAIVDSRPSYGYRRVAVLLNAQLTQTGLARVNHKRVYRIMQQHKLLLPQYGKKPVRTHEGKVITLRSNTRWCSDTLGIQCTNGDTLYVAFAIDTCDREVLGYIASTIGIEGQAIRDLLVECVEYRFGPVLTLPHTIQWLTDNGSCYTARETVQSARGLGFEVCTTPAYSPQSNGIAEAFVKTFKRDYVYLTNLSSAQAVMEQLHGWFEDYNNHAPHKGLNMRSPRQFLREQLMG